MKPILAAFLAATSGTLTMHAAGAPNIVLIYADDLGYGDVSCYGATKVATPNIDRLAHEGRRFTRAYATSATCTPSRYGLLTGEYPWRRHDAKVLPGNARLLIAPGRTTLPGELRLTGYTTAAIGKWHLGLGDAALDWNKEIKPGPLEIGFDTCFLLPATGDRVPCVFVENRHVVGLDPRDPISVSYTTPIGGEPTGRDHPELLKYPLSHGHDHTIINGVSRIGYMSGGKAARWIDEDIADTLTQRATSFIEQNKSRPFFLYFSTHDIHVPRAPHARFAGKSGLGVRGDVILQLDASVGHVLDTLDRLGLAANTIVVLTSDNGPVINDGYRDGSVESLDGHAPAGPLRGGKYSVLEAGTRVPMLVRWPGRVQSGVSDALFSQIDFLATFAGLVGRPLSADSAGDSRDALRALLGEDSAGRDYVIEHASNGRLGVVAGKWKYIEPGPGPERMPTTGIETGNASEPQLYNLADDPGETKNLAAHRPEKVVQLQELLDKVRGDS